jgi:hypothetical protein
MTKVHLFGTKKLYEKKPIFNFFTQVNWLKGINVWLKKAAKWFNEVFCLVHSFFEKNCLVHSTTMMVAICQHGNMSHQKNALGLSPHHHNPALSL